MENFLENGNLYPAFVIYNDFINHFKTRTDWALKRLDEPFDFEKEILFESDRTESQWMKSQAEADVVWDDFIHYQVLNELLSSVGEANDSSDEETIDTKALEKQLNRLFSDQTFLLKKWRLLKNLNVATTNLGVWEDEKW